LKGNKGYIDFQLWMGEKTMFDFIKLYFICFKYDILYDTLCCVTKQMGVLFRLFRPCKLVTIMHHPPFTKILRYTRSDAYIFFDITYRNMAVRDIPSMKDRYKAIRWQPDKEWYAGMLAKIGRPETSYDFIDNGKTARDHELMAKAVYETNSRTVLINHPDLRPKNYREGGCLTFINQFRPDDTILLHYLSSSACVLVPCRKKEGQTLLGPVGSTSFMDAIALGKPVICSDNLYFADEVKRYELGLVYEAGNQDSLAACMRKMKDDTVFRQACAANMRRYAEGKSIANYSRELFVIFGRIVD